MNMDNEDLYVTHRIILLCLLIFIMGIEFQNVKDIFASNSNMSVLA